jgi:hypothetical protein
MNKLQQRVETDTISSSEKVSSDFIVQQILKLTKAIRWLHEFARLRDHLNLNHRIT